jgi:hypothetical protein
LERGQAELSLCLGQVDHVGCSSHLQKFAEFSRELLLMILNFAARQLFKSLSERIS